MRWLLLVIAVTLPRAAKADLPPHAPARSGDDPVVAAQAWLDALKVDDLDRLMKASAFPFRFPHSVERLNGWFSVWGEFRWELIDWGIMSGLRQNAEQLAAQLQVMTPTEIRTERKHHRPTVLDLADGAHRFVWSNRLRAENQVWK